MPNTREEGQKRTNDAQKRAQQIINEAKHMATEEAQRIVAMAKEEALQQIEAMRNQLRDQVASLAVAGAERILKKEINASVHADLLTQLKAEL